MKALLKIITGGGKALASVKYILTLKGGTEKDKKQDMGARVRGVWMSDNLKDIKQDNFKALAKRIEAPTRLFCSKKGRYRHRDHLVISAQAGESMLIFKYRIPQAIEDLKKELQIETYVAVLHGDCKHPHLHIVCDAYAPGVGKGQRRHVNRSKLRRLNENLWSKDFEAPTPSADGTHSDRGDAILKEKFKGAPKTKVDLASEIFYKLDGKLGDVEEMAERLEGADCKDMRLDFRDSKGNVKKSAVVIKRGVKVRLSWLLLQKKNLLLTKQFEHVINKPKETADKTTGDRIWAIAQWEKAINPKPPKPHKKTTTKNKICGACGNLKSNCSCDDSR